MGRRERPSQLLRLMLRLTPRLTPGCIITVLAMLLIPMAMDITDTGWPTLATATTSATTATISATTDTWDTTARGRLRLNQLPRLMLTLPQRLTPGCTIATLVTDSIHTDTATTGMGLVMLPMLDTTRTLTTEAAEMATEPWFPAPGNSVEVSALVLMK